MEKKDREGKWKKYFRKMPKVSSHPRFPTTCTRYLSSMTCNPQRHNGQWTILINLAKTRCPSLNRSNPNPSLSRGLPPSLVAWATTPDETSSAHLSADVHLTSRDVRAWHSATMQMHFATVAESLHEVEPLVRWRVKWEGGSGLCMLRTDSVMAV